MQNRGFLLPAGDNVNTGAKQNSCDIAKRMFEKGIDIETISELTGLTAEEVSRLKKEMINA